MQIDQIDIDVMLTEAVAPLLARMELLETQVNDLNMLAARLQGLAGEPSHYSLRRDSAAPPNGVTPPMTIHAFLARIAGVAHLAGAAAKEARIEELRKEWDGFKAPIAHVLFGTVVGPDAVLGLEDCSGGVGRRLEHENTHEQIEGHAKRHELAHEGDETYHLSSDDLVQSEAPKVG